MTLTGAMIKVVPPPSLDDWGVSIFLIKSTWRVNKNIIGGWDNIRSKMENMTGEYRKSNCDRAV